MRKPPQDSVLEPPLLSQAQLAASAQDKGEHSIPTGTAKRRRWRNLLLLILAGPCILAGGLMLQSTVVGEVLIGVYAVVALLWRIESRVTFLLALVSIGGILVILLTRPDPELMKNFAIYAFLFIVVGTLSITVETRY